MNDKNLHSRYLNVGKRDRIMSTSENTTKDDGLIGNEKIEEAIAALQQETSEELLAHALTVVRRRMREHGQVILAVDMPQIPQDVAPQMQYGQTGMLSFQSGFTSAQAGTSATPMQIQAVKTADGKAWWTVFTSFDEELRGGSQVKSTFLADLEQIFRTALTVPEIEGVILNPWNRTMMLDKNLIRIILGES